MVTRGQVLAYRWRVQELDSVTGATKPPRNVAILDLGVQNGANDAARLGLINRGVSVPAAVGLMAGFGDDLALAWTIRGAPHLYRREELPHVATATSPYSEADARKRVFTAAPSLRAVGVDVLDALAEVSRQLRKSLTVPRTKGELSAALRQTLPHGYQSDCRPCGCLHSFEMTFRLAALYAGLELEPGTSPPVLRRVPEWPKGRRLGPAPDPLAAPKHLQPVRAYLHYLGPATPKDVAAFLDSQVSQVKAVWPQDTVEVDRAGERAWILVDDEPALREAGEPDLGEVKLLSGYDALITAKDRHLLVAQRARAKELWPSLGRPGAIAAGGELLGIWRPKSGKDGVTVQLTPWRRLDRRTLATLREQAEMLACSRAQAMAAVINGPPPD